jgi:hypothetical protein
MGISFTSFRSLPWIAAKRALLAISFTTARAVAGIMGKFAILPGFEGARTSRALAGAAAALLSGRFSSFSWCSGAFIGGVQISLAAFSAVTLFSILFKIAARLDPGTCPSGVGVGVSSAPAALIAGSAGRWVALRRFRSFQICSYSSAIRCRSGSTAAGACWSSSWRSSAFMALSS